MSEETTAAEALHYIRGRLAALDTDIHALKNQRADRRHQIATNISCEVNRIRWALGYLPDDCNAGKQGTNNLMPALAAFASGILRHYHADGCVDGDDLVALAEACNVLVARTMPRPCGAECVCNEFANAEEWPILCLRDNVDGSVIDPRALKANGGEA